MPDTRPQASWKFPLPVDWGCLLPLSGLVAALVFTIVFLIGPGAIQQRFSLAGWITLAVFGVLIVMMVSGPHIQVTTSEIRVVARWAKANSAPLLTRIPLHEIQIESAAVVDLLSRQDLAPHASIAERYASRHGEPQGYYSLANGQHAVVLLSRRTHVLYLPTRTGEVWLASLRDSQGCLELLRSLCGGSPQ